MDRVELLRRAAHHAEGPAPARAVAHIEAAIELVDPAADPSRAGLLHERLGQYSWLALDLATALAASEEAVRLVPAEPPSATRSRVLSGLGRIYMETDRPADALLLCEAALTVARKAGAREVETHALNPLGRCLVSLGDVELGLATLRRASDLATELGDVAEVARAMTWRTYALVDANRRGEAVAAGLQAEAYASAHGLQARWGINALGMAVRALIDLGRWDEAEAHLTRAQEYELPGVLELQVEGMAIFLETGRGQFESANRRAPRVRLLAERFEAGHSAYLAWLALWQDDPLAARAAIEDGPEDPFVRYRIWALAAGIRAEADLAVLARARHTEPELAEARSRGAALLARLSAVVENVVGHVPILTGQMVTVRTEAEAELARLEGRPDPDRWASAAAGWQQQEMPFETGYALMREAEATLEAGRDRSQGCPRAERRSRHCRSAGSGAAPSGH